MRTKKFEVFWWINWTQLVKVNSTLYTKLDKLELAYWLTWNTYNTLYPTCNLKLNNYTKNSQILGLVLEGGKYKKWHNSELFETEKLSKKEERFLWLCDTTVSQQTNQSCVHLLVKQESPYHHLVLPYCLFNHPINIFIKDKSFHPNTSAHKYCYYFYRLLHLF